MSAQGLKIASTTSDSAAHSSLPPRQGGALGPAANASSTCLHFRDRLSHGVDAEHGIVLDRSSTFYGAGKSVIVNVVNRTLSIDDTEPPKISVDALSAKLPDAERLRVAKALVVAAFKVCPKDHLRDDLIGPSNLELANCMLGAVNSLLRTQAESRRTEWWDAQRARQDSFARPH